MERLLMEQELKASSARGQCGACLIERGFYSEQLTRYWKWFPDQQILILRFDEWVSEPKKTLLSVCRFLGIDPDRPTRPNEAQSPPIRNYPPMSGADRDYLRGRFKDEIRRLELLLGWDCTHWT